MRVRATESARGNEGGRTVERERRRGREGGRKEKKTDSTCDRKKEKGARTARSAEYARQM